jgi:AcrR family transcriptional regulator
LEAIFLNEKKVEIYRCGKAIFEEKGFKATNIAEIMKLADMGTGTFYNYYTSKDQLFMEIYNDENVKLKKGLMASIDLDADSLCVMKEMLSKNLQGMLENPILKEWYNKEVFHKLEQNFRAENGIDHVDFLYSNFIEVVKKWQAEGKMRADLSAELIMAIFGALINVETHKEEIGLQYFPQVIEYLAEFTMKGLLEYPKDETK